MHLVAPKLVRDSSRNVRRVSNYSVEVTIEDFLKLGCLPQIFALFLGDCGRFKVENGGFYLADGAREI